MNILSTARRTAFALMALVLSSSCAASTEDDENEQTGASTDALTHAELASVMPSHLAIMFAMSWFGIPKSGDPLGPGPDASWGNWQIPGTCSPKGAPASCVNGQRDVASRYRPLAGIYSSSGRNDESLARIRLMLSTLRRPCANDVGARIDSFAIQLDGTRYTSLHDSTPAGSAENAYQSLVHTLAEADAAGLTNAVLPGDDATWYWNNGHWVGLDCKASRATCVAAVQQDVNDMLAIALKHPSSLRIAGKPVLYFYVNGQLTPAEWSSIFAKARATHDFFAIASKQGGGAGPYFAAFDGISPWIDSYAWDNTSGATVRAHAAAYAAKQHAELYASVPAGKVVFGSVTPGFDDFTNGWSLCKTRQMPRPTEAHPRDPGLLDGSIDFLETKHAKGVILQTWDDWTEGSFFEPSVSEGTTKLEQLQARLGELYGEPRVTSKPLHDRWVAYGQPHGCAGAKPSPHIDLCAPPPATTCGPPTILEPTNGMNVGPSIHLRVSAPSCIDAMIPYIDSQRAIATTVQGSSIDAWIPVTMGTHTLNVNGWDAKGAVYPSTKISFTRTY